MISPPWIWPTMIDFDVTGLPLIDVPLVHSSRSDSSAISLFSATISYLIPQVTKIDYEPDGVALHQIVGTFWMEDAWRTLQANGKTMKLSRSIGLSFGDWCCVHTS